MTRSPDGPRAAARALDDPARLEALRRTGLVGSEPEDAFDRLTRLAAGLLGTPAALLSLVDDEHHFVKSRAGLAQPLIGRRRMGLRAMLCRRVVETARPLVVADARADGRVASEPAVTAFDIGAYLGVPLVDGDGHVLGALCVIDHHPRPWNEEHIDGLRDLAAAAMTEVALRRSREDARLTAVSDGLTGLWNRRHFVDALAAELERGSREGHGPGVVVIHLDDLHQVNAAQGEVAGDAFLAACAVAVTRALRPYDLAARWSGARLAVMAPNVPDDDALRAIGRKLCATLTSDARLVALGVVGVSAGAARVAPGLEHPTTLMRAAELALATTRARGGGGVTLSGGGPAPEDAATVDDGAAEHAVQRAAEAVAAQGPTAGALAAVAREAAPLAGGDAAFVLRYIAGDRVEIVAEWRRPGTPPAGHLAVMPLRQAAAASLVRATGCAGRARSAAGDRFGCVERAGAPVMRAGELWGAVVAVTHGPAPLAGHAEARLGELGDHLGMALSKTATGDRIVSEAAATILLDDLDASATLTAVAEAARRALGADRATCYEHSLDQRRIVAVHTTETDPARRATLERAIGLERPELPFWHRLLAGPGMEIAVEDVRDAGIDDRLRARLGLGAVIGVRLEHSSVRTGGEPTLLGSLFLTFSAPRRFSAAELATARSLAALAALAIANGRLHSMTAASLAEAEERAAVDPLTGLANHRTFQERLRAEIARARRERRSVALAVFDLDHFKTVNDRHGHQAGDRLLVQFARRLAAEARPSDIVARVGGEEFAWVLPGADAVQGWEAADRLRRSLEEDPLPGPRRVTVSGGVCDLSDARDADELYRLADGALYWAKAHGRDTVLRYSPEVVHVLSAQEQADRLERSQTLTSVRALARVVDAKDPSTLRHSGRVADLAVRLATALGWPVERTVTLREAGLVHDVGKIGVPDQVLFKRGRLDEHEYEQVKAHAPLGAEIVAEVLSREAATWVRGHHERWDGRGYPDGLAGEDIPEGARILALADSWDVMVHVRHYKEPMSVPDAMEECRRHSGGQFWPPAVAALERLLEVGALELEEPSVPAGA